MGGFAYLWGKPLAGLLVRPPRRSAGFFFAPFRFPLPLPVPGLPPPTPDLPDPYQIYPTPTRLTRPLPDLPDPYPTYPTPTRFTRPLPDLPDPYPTYPTPTRLTRPLPDLPDPPQIYPTPPRFTRPPPDLPDPPPDLPDPPLRVGKPRTPLLRPSQRDFGGRLPHLPDPSLSTFISPFAHSPSPLPIPYPPPFFLYPSVIKERSGRWGSRGKKRPVTAFSRGFSPSPPKKGGRVSRGGGRVKKGGVGKVG